MIGMSPLEPQCNQALKIRFENHLRALIFFHLEEHKSAQHLLQVLEQNDFARNEIALKEGIKKRSFSEATNSRGLEQFMYVFKNLQAKGTKVLPTCHPDFGNLVGIDGSLIDATLSMYWAGYRKRSKKVIKVNQIDPNSIVFYDAIVLLGTAGINQTEKPVRLVGYEVDAVKYWIATNRLDLSAEQIAAAYKLRFDNLLATCDLLLRTA
jgi:hypothetical protein